MNESIRILIVEDLPTDAELAQREIRQALKATEFRRVETREAYLAALESFQPDLVVSDYGLPHFDGLTALKLALEYAPLTPVIILTGALNEDIAVACMKAGAVDYVIKEHSKRLGPAVLQALAQKEVRRERLQAAEALRQSEQKFRSFVEQSSEGFTLVDEQGVIIEWNQAREQMTGYRREQVMGRPFWDVQRELLPPEVRTPGRYEHHKQVIQEALRTGQSYLFTRTFEAQVLKPTGERRFLQQTIFPIKTDRGYRIGSVSRDITAQRQAEEQLRKLSQAVEQSPASIVITNLAGDIEYVNPRFSQITGYTAAEVIGQNPRLLKSGYTSPEEYKRLWAIITSGGEWRGEFRNKKKNGDFYWEAATISPILNEQGEITHFLAVKEDITGRKWAEEALRESEERYRRLVELSPDPIFLHQAGRFVFVNAAGLKLLGAQTPADLLGKPVLEVVHPDYRQVVIERVRQATSAGKPVPAIEEKLLRLDDSSVDVEVSAVSLLYDGQPTMQVIARDITERKQAEAARLKLEARLRQAQKMESIGRLAGGVAHDFNNLLTVIQGHCGLMQAEMLASDPLFEDLEQIRLASERAANLTRQLLVFSRQQVLAPVVLDLNRLVANLRKMLERWIGEDINLVTLLQPGLQPVTADPGQIEQVIMNLAVNARDAMPQGGQLTIETGNVWLDDSFAGAHPDAPLGDCVLLAVSDTGLGMDETTLAHIFEPFFTTKGPEQGTGLGLATVYGIVKQSRGEIIVSSQPGQGASFKIYLPAGGSAPGPATETVPSPARQRGSETILLVEDDTMVRKLARAALQEQGYTVLEARQGSEALTLAELHQGPIDLLLTDVVMPHMSGRELAERLKALQPRLKVLFTSGYTDDTVVRYGLLAAEIEFLPKPFSPAVLAARVRQVLEK